MTKPKNAQMELLHYLLTRKQVTTRDIQRELFILNVTATISMLRRKGVQILCENVKTRNRYGRPVNYGKFSILNKNQSKDIYQISNK
jgi:hypothetical protein